MPLKSPAIMYAYAGFLVACGLIAFALSGFAALTALVAPAAFGLLMVICGVMASKVHTNRTVGMIGIHIGLGLPVIYMIGFIWLSYGRFTREEPVVYLGTIFAIMAAGSLAAFIAILLTRPKPEARV